MFDNFSLNQIKKGIKIVNQRAKIEVSGLKNEKDLTKLSHLEIDFISMGDLTTVSYTHLTLPTSDLV